MAGRTKGGFFRRNFVMMQVMLRTPEEDEMLNMLHHGTGWIREENLDAVLDWYSQQK